MRVLLVGGGSGGHITPLLAVAKELKRRQPPVKIYYALEKGSRFEDLPRKSAAVDGVHTVRSGKLRRYHGESWARRAVDIPTNARNLRDGAFVVAGYFQARKLLRKLRPDVVFIKGSSVGVPIGKACQALNIPYFTHDSDSVASLTNRLLAKQSKVHAVGMPLANDSKDSNARYTGIPLADEYKLVDSSLMKHYRRQLDLPTDSLVLTVTGGSLGAQRLNKAVLAVAPDLLEEFGSLRILHQTGSHKSLYTDLPAELASRVRETAFTDELVAWTGAADLVLARAGATTIAELAVQGKACIFVPNPELTGGQQTHNAVLLAKQQVAAIITEAEAADPSRLKQRIRELLRDQKARQKLAANIHKIAKDDAASQLADIIVELAK